jgi:hypothetical protein
VKIALDRQEIRSRQNTGGKIPFCQSRQAVHQGLRAQPTGLSIEAAFCEAIRTIRQQKSVSLLKRADG